MRFKGGTHPYEGKELSKDAPIRDIEPKGDLVFPLIQHIGAPASPTVKVGDEVLVGQIIGEASGTISASVISSVSGKVKKIEPRRVANGSFANSIVVENDHQYRTIEGFGQDRDYTKLSKEEIRSIVKNAGIVGLGGAGFPTEIKITPPADKKIEYVLLNGAECEPYLTSDYRLMLEHSNEVVEGLQILLQLFEGAKGIIGIEDNKPDAIAKMKEASSGKQIEVASLHTKYPQGGERALIKAITGREVHSALLPADVGCIVVNVATALAIYEAVAKSTPLVQKIVCISGEAIQNPSNFRVRIGMNATELIEEAGGFSKEVKKLICGGPMMGMALFTTDVPVVKAFSSLLAFSYDEVEIWKETPCIKCGRCVEVCPSKLVPVFMMKYALKNDADGFEKVHGMECIECGCCTFVCPAKRPLTQGFKHAKNLVNAKRRANKEKEKK